MDGHDSDDDSHPELVVDSDEEDESSSTERPRTFASLSDTGHPEPAVARAPAESAADAQGPPERGPNEHLDVAARALVRAEGLSAVRWRPGTHLSPVRSLVPRPQSHQERTRHRKLQNETVSADCGGPRGLLCTCGHGTG